MSNGTKTSHLADLLQSYMDARGMNQAEAARACGMSDSQMSSLMRRPRRSWVEPDTLQKLWAGLRVPTPEIMDAVSRDIGLGPLIDLTEDDPRAKATAQFIADLSPDNQRRAALMLRTMFGPDFRDDEK